MNDMGCVCGEASSFAQSIAHQGDIPLGQVTDPSVHEFSRAARGPLAKIAPLDEEDLQPTACSIQRNAGTGRSTSDDSDIPWIAPLSNDP